MWCPNCGTVNRPTARFCMGCGATLVSPAQPTNVSPSLAPNTLLQNRYGIVRQIGKGGMSAVYEARDTRLASKRWAVKQMSDVALPLAERTQAIAAFQHEAHMLASLDHPNLPKVIDYFAEGNCQYLVMEFIEGQTLEDILVSTPGLLAEVQVLEWADQLCEVLEYLHSRQPPVIFRDLKPVNTMLTHDGRIKLIDFGIARLFKPGQSRDTAAFGTAGYAAPEQYGTGQTDARSDIYSLGVTLHRLLTRHDPTLTPFNLPPIRSFNPDVSEGLAKAIGNCLRLAPEERFQSAAEARVGLLLGISIGWPNSHADVMILVQSGRLIEAALKYWRQPVETNDDILWSYFTVRQMRAVVDTAWVWWRYGKQADFIGELGKHYYRAFFDGSMHDEVILDHLQGADVGKFLLLVGLAHEAIGSFQEAMQWYSWSQKAWLDNPGLIARLRSLARR